MKNSMRNPMVVKSSVSTATMCAGTDGSIYTRNATMLPVMKEKIKK